ncbi:hypothetical protein Fcan01_06946 [Folsomia candida]|uniref:Uncharacterized protein n=1 Tax=Folsomia candida TaxID=158441 RepID=A0A226END8_FOLCA|nr:hypothetical protein Fcan01_06946 [Folsomia candida]
MAQLPPNLPKPSSPFLAFLVISSVTLVSPSYQYQEVDHSYESDSVYGEHSSGMSKTDVTLHELGVPKERPKNLTCHVCYSETNGMECMNFSSLSISPASISVDGDDDGETNNEVHRHWTRDSLPGSGFQGFPQQCLNESYVCSVRKFAFSLSNGTGHAPMKTFAIKRNCTLQSKCEPGCVVMGERTRM